MVAQTEKYEKIAKGIKNSNMYYMRSIFKGTLLEYSYFCSVWLPV